MRCPSTRRAKTFVLAASALLACASCGPWGPRGVIAGGPLVGPSATRPAAEACDDSTLLAALETRDGWLRHSVTLFCVSHDGAVYIPSRNGGTKRWTRNALADSRVRLEIHGEIHDGRLVRVMQVDDGVAHGLLRKVTGVEVSDARFLLEPPQAGDDRTDLWLFRFDEDAS